MEWIEPKTDWKVEYDENGNYVGDYFNVQDMNRIYNNLACLTNLVNSIFAINKATLLNEYSLGDPIRYTDVRNILMDLKLINRYVSNDMVNRFLYGDPPNENGYDIVDTITDGAIFPDWNFWQNVERSIQLLYKDMLSISNNKRKLKYRFGIPNTGGF